MKSKQTGAPDQISNPIYPVPLVSWKVTETLCHAPEPASTRGVSMTSPEAGLPEAPWRVTDCPWPGEHPGLITQRQSNRYDSGQLKNPFPFQVQGSGSNDSVNLVGTATSGNKTAVVGASLSPSGYENIIFGMAQRF
jgi:hypothetical protein